MRNGRTGRAVLGLLALIASCSHAPPPEALAAGRLGRVLLYRPAGAETALVFLFSDASGWSFGADRAAEALRARGAVVLGVDLARYLEGLRASDDGCHYVVAELEALSQRVQRELDRGEYRSPILSGVGQGAVLAYAALAQAPAATLAGAVSVDAAPGLPTRVPLCAGAAATPTGDGGFSYAPGAALPGFFRASESAGDDPFERLAELLVPELAASGTAGEGSLADLPLTVLPAAQPGPWMAVVWSGDGGWRDIDKQIAEELARSGTPTVGVDSLRYFWRRKSPEQMARDLARIMRHYGGLWGTRQVLLVGYSFGADVLPFAYLRLAPEERARVVQLSLLGLAADAPFEFQVSGWLGGRPARALPVLPEMARIELRRVQCFYGEEEQDTVCRAPELAGAEIVRTGGGHHFDGDYRALARRILAGAQARSADSALPGDDAADAAGDQRGDVGEHDRHGEPAG